MTNAGVAANDASSAPARPASANGDVAGRDRMAKNVLASWAGHLVLVVGGFIMPRLIDDRVGQTALGVWDFGWSLVSYFGLAEVGVGSSVNRYIAKYRAAGDNAGVNRTVSSVMAIQWLAALLVVALTAAATWSAPMLLSERLGGLLNEARWVILFLGLGLAVQMAFNGYVGVITGCHRWDLHNAINSTVYLVTTLGMVVVLAQGGGLKGLAMTHFVGTALGETTRAWLAHRVCPELRIRRRDARWDVGVRLLKFGGKTMLGTVSSLLLYQANSLLVVSHLGAAALAAYSRPLALVRHVRTFVSKFAFTLVPMASSLHATGQAAEVRDLMMETGRYAAYIALPPLVFAALMGDLILRVWMGPGYELGTVLTILALGHLVTTSQQPLVNVLAGMNAHLPVSVAECIGSLIAVGLSALALGPLGLGLHGAAAALVLPLLLLNGVFVTIYACRRLGVPVSGYLVAAWRGPLAAMVPFATTLALTRLLLQDRPGLCLLAGVAAGGLVVAAIYWQWVLPRSAKALLWSRRPSAT